MRLVNAIAVMLVVLVSGCAARGPVGVDPNKPTAVGGTIAGIVRTASDTPLSGRKVTAINVATGERIDASTSMNGGYTIKVAPGHYRLEVELRAGEVVLRPPDEVHISTSDIDAGRDFVVTMRPISR